MNAEACFILRHRPRPRLGLGIDATWCDCCGIDFPALPLDTGTVPPVSSEVADLTCPDSPSGAGSTVSPERLTSPRQGATALPAVQAG